ncbi:MAG TPA: sialidase family protein [Candidatus Dormibacteraeota bacterium]|nr:sialidase family protein [Candidatus Dormibacteraeota bacterium]
MGSSWKRCPEWQVWKHLPALLLALTVAGCFAASPELTKSGQTGDEKGKKIGTGKSFIAETMVVQAPPAPPGGWDAERVMSGQDDWEPANAVDPVNPNYVYQLTTRYTGPKPCGNCKLPAIVLRRSTDGGATWVEQFLSTSGKAQYDPQIVVASTGWVYAVWLDAFTPGSTFVRSMDRGVTWSTGISWSGNGKKPQWNDKPWLGISRDGQHVYLGFNSSDSYIVSSHDFGASFSAPVKTNSDTRYWFHSGAVVSPSNPMVAWFATSNYSSGNNYNGDSNVEVLKTTNGGVSWSDVHIDTSREVPLCTWAAGCNQGFLGTQAALAIDSAGKLMVVYNSNDTPDVPEQIYFKTSTDGGATWSARTKLSVASAAVNNGFPMAAAHPTTAGDFRVVWQDDRIFSHSGWNTWYKRTTNGGTSWTADVRLSDLTSGAPYKSVNGYAFPYGDYGEIDVDSNGRNYVVWGEGASYTGPGGTWYTRGN